MRKFRKVKGSELAESYKKGWEMAINTLEKISPSDIKPTFIFMLPKKKNAYLSLDKFIQMGD